ncbi:MFS transporter [Mycolicibacterium neoaurum]|uniref:MFS transporter n=1 Tax=Mycolicibacterium neoaurum TaxID=1795 RepID=UPI00248B2B8B|nr:MFS transporter [Mycolicibacterium neoaurum]WBP95717.1 MFS transporter [Mycolicibacterium neoaurum]WBS09400.1 MFS transporter [Mycolicibacterium neoaurum]
MAIETPGGTIRAGRREWSALGVLVLVVTLLAIDGTVLYLAVPSLTADIGPSATQLLWIGDIYSFVLAGLLITMGNIADRIGRKRLLLIGAAAFGAASTLAAFAPDAGTLIVARALLGIAGATLMPSTLSIVRAMFADAKQRTTAIAIWSAGAMAGAAAGPLVGGLLLEHYWWGSVFLINLPIMALVLIAGPILIPESRGDAATGIDIWSSLLSIAAIVPLVYAVKHWVGSGWDAGVPVAALVGIVGGWLFLRRQRTLTHPLLDITLFRVPAFAGAVASNGLAIFAFIGLLYFYSQYLQLVRQFGPLQAGLAELPGTLASIAVIAVVGAVSTRLGAGRAIGLGLATGALGLTGIGLSVFHAGYWPLALALVVIGFGIGIAMTLSTDAVVSAVPTERAGAASAIAETAYELGTALGIAVLGSLHFLMYRSHLDLPVGTAPTDAASANASLAKTITTVSDPVVIEHARDAFATAVQTTAFTAAGLLVLAAVAAWRVIPSDRIGLRKDSHGGN